MLSQDLAEKLTKIACKQLKAGEKMKKDRMNTVREIEDLYYGKIEPIGDNRINIPFPFMGGFIDDLMSKIDNQPNVTFKIPNREQVSRKLESAWKIDTTSMRSSWQRKDREEKFMALLSGRGIGSIFASSAENKYKGHYNVIDHFNFVCEGTRGHLEDMMYHGETGIWKTKYDIDKMLEKGIYNPEQAKKLFAGKDNGEVRKDEEVQQKVERWQSLGLNPEQNAYVGQTVYSFTQWIMRYEGESYYLLFHPESYTWLRAEKLKDVFGNNKTPYVSWTSGVTNPSVFWTTGPGDSVLPVAEAMRLILNEALENVRRRNRPMRITKGGDFMDINEIRDYLPDNVITTESGKNGEIITIETPEISASIDIVNYLNNLLTEKTGMAGQGVDDQDAKVGVFYGQLQREADRIGIVNKNYSESYAEKGYRWFWGIKEHLTENKSIEMLGKGGLQWDELSKTELNDVDDVDDIVVTGGSREEQANAIRQQTQADTLAALTGNPLLANELSPKWTVKSLLKSAGFEEDDVQEALDKEGDPNRDLMNEADQAIQEILLGKQPKINRGANTAYMQRILDFSLDNMDYIKFDKNGTEIGIDEKIKEKHDKLLAFMYAHQPIVIENMQRDLRKKQAEMKAGLPQTGQVDLPEQTKQEQQMNLARPFENPQGTPEGTQAMSQNVTNNLG